MIASCDTMKILTRVLIRKIEIRIEVLVALEFISCRLE
jgi:hypothetical protein